MNAGIIARMCCYRRGMILGPQYLTSRWLTTTAVRSAALTERPEDFWDKNKRLQRPVSPHLTIYKLQITSVLSVTHRGTGLALSALTSGFAIGMLALPGSFPHYLSALETTHLGSAVILGAKFLLAFPFFFHFCNGIRHLAWDLGLGFQIKSVYTSGYAVLGTSVLLAAVVAAM